MPIGVRSRILSSCSMARRPRAKPRCTPKVHTICERAERHASPKPKPNPGSASPLEPLESQSSPSLRVACVPLPHSRGQPRHRACVPCDGAACSALGPATRSSGGHFAKSLLMFTWPAPQTAVATPSFRYEPGKPRTDLRSFSTVSCADRHSSTYTCTSPPGSRDRDAVGSVWSLSPIFPPCCVPPGLLMPVWPVSGRGSRVALPPLGADSQHAGDSQRHRYLRLRLSTGKMCRRAQG